MRRVAFRSPSGLARWKPSCGHHDSKVQATLTKTGQLRMPAAPVTARTSGPPNSTKATPKPNSRPSAAKMPKNRATWSGLGSAPGCGGQSGRLRAVAGRPTASVTSRYFFQVFIQVSPLNEVVVSVRCLGVSGGAGRLRERGILRLGQPLQVAGADARQPDHQRADEAALDQRSESPAGAADHDLGLPGGRAVRV